jgi:magnesium chelatase family protein
LRITANLAPGALRKEGTHYDLSIALGILAADGRIPPEAIDGWVSVGELGLDGTVRPVRGVLAAAIACCESKRNGIICPASNAPEAAAIDGIKVIPVSSLRDAIDFFRGKWSPPTVLPREATSEDPDSCMSEVRGQADAKWALEIAAAGGHNLFLIGAPGSGKTMLARRLPTIIPPMSFEESLEVTRLYSVAGLLPDRASLISERPFRSPHQHISIAGLLGGGSGLARPGEVSLAHHGVLFLDEVSLFRSDVLESLRAPLEEGVVRLARSGGVVTYPARFSLVAASNPCPCGFADDPRIACRCTNQQLMAHDSKLSGPLLDRIDMQILVEPLGSEELLGRDRAETSDTIRARVEKARAKQTERYGSTTLTNATVPKSLLDESLNLSHEGRARLKSAIQDSFLTGRGVTRVLRVARTIADLQDDSSVTPDAIVLALGLRLRGAEALA